MYTKEQFLKYPRRRLKKAEFWKASHAKGQKKLIRISYYRRPECPICKHKMHWNRTFSEWYCVYCMKALKEMEDQAKKRREEIWEAFGRKD